MLYLSMVFSSSKEVLKYRNKNDPNCFKVFQTINQTSQTAAAHKEYSGENDSKNLCGIETPPQGRHDIQHNGTQHSDIRHNGTQPSDIWDNGTQHSDIWDNDTQHSDIRHNDTA